MQDEIIIKTFINKAIAFTKYSYYAKTLGESGFEGERESLEDLAKHKLYEAFALLDRLGYKDCTNLLQDVVESEQKQVESQRNCIENQEDWFVSLIKADEWHLRQANELLKDSKSERAHVEKKCLLCSYKDKGGKEYVRCPRCGASEFLSGI